MPMALSARTTPSTGTRLISDLVRVRVGVGVGVRVQVRVRVRDRVRVRVRVRAGLGSGSGLGFGSDLRLGELRQDVSEDGGRVEAVAVSGAHTPRAARPLIRRGLRGPLELKLGDRVALLVLALLELALVSVRARARVRRGEEEGEG